MSARAENGVRLVFSVDVEEEGLFSGRYAARAEGVSNVAALSRLEFLARDHGLPLTLLCTWPVLADAACAALLRRWQDELGAEIGAHLHPWNTPPLADGAATDWTPSEAMDPALLEAKLATLLAACGEVAGRAPTSFRMGRFDLGPKVRGLLSRHGLRVDSSLVPGRHPDRHPIRYPGALPMSFLCPADPHPLAAAPGDEARVLEAPITMVPLLPGLPRLAWAAAKLLPEGAGASLLRSFRRWAMTGVQPAWFPLASMKLAARLHLARGGRVIHMFLHSSELSPGHAAHLPDEAAVERVLARIRAFIPWLGELARPFGGLRPTTLSGLPPMEIRP
jgi:hypothetical protein